VRLRHPATKEKTKFLAGPFTCQHSRCQGDNAAECGFDSGLLNAPKWLMSQALTNLTVALGEVISSTREQSYLEFVLISLQDLAGNCANLGA
jgi:hypothetical protein